jgi:hypothetical protein
MSRTVLVWLLLSLSLVACGQDVKSGLTLEPFYAIGYSESESLYVIWKVDADAPQLIYHLSAVSLLPVTEMLSEREVRGFLGACEGVFAIDPGNPPVKQMILGVWQIDANQLLIQTYRQLCISSYSVYCFGDTRLSILDVRMNDEIEIWRLDCSDQLISTYVGCFPPDMTRVVDIAFNPTNHKIAVGVKAFWDRFYDVTTLATVIILDLNDPFAPITQIDSAEYPIWSLDGQKLAYSSKACFQGCTTTLSVYDVQSNASSIIQSASLFFGFPVVFGFDGSDILVYQWQNIPLGDAPRPTIIVSHDLVTGQMDETIFEAMFFTGNFLSLVTHTGLTLIGQMHNGDVAQTLYIVNGEAVVGISIPQVHSIFYNGRYPQYVFLAGTQSSTLQFAVLTADGNQYSIDLTNVIPVGYIVEYLSPAGLQNVW